MANQKAKKLNKKKRGGGGKMDMNLQLVQPLKSKFFLCRVTSYKSDGKNCQQFWKAMIYQIRQEIHKRKNRRGEEIPSDLFWPV